MDKLEFSFNCGKAWLRDYNVRIDLDLDTLEEIPIHLRYDITLINFGASVSFTYQIFDKEGVKLDPKTCPDLGALTNVFNNKFDLRYGLRLKASKNKLYIRDMHLMDKPVNKSNIKDTILDIFDKEEDFFIMYYCSMGHRSNDAFAGPSGIIVLNSSCIDCSEHVELSIKYLDLAAPTFRDEYLVVFQFRSKGNDPTPGIHLYEYLDSIKKLIDYLTSDMTSKKINIKLDRIDLNRCKLVANVISLYDHKNLFMKEPSGDDKESKLIASLLKGMNCSFRDHMSVPNLLEKELKEVYKNGS